MSCLSASPMSPNGFASGSFDGNVRIWDIRNPSGSVFNLDRTLVGKIFTVDWTEIGLFAGGQDGKIEIWKGPEESTTKMKRFS